MPPKVVWTVLSTFALLGAAPPPAQPQPDPVPDIVVLGARPPHCHRRPDDPADAVAVPRGQTGQSVIAPDAKTKQLVWQVDREPVLGADVWQRAGTGIGEYVFRVPDHGLPMCIGAVAGSPAGWGQLRQIIRLEKRATGKYLHFSALVAARDAGEIRFWLMAAASRGLGSDFMAGGDTSPEHISGTFGWKQIDLVAGPIPYNADHASYGFLLWGKGDVWLANAKLQVQTRDEVKDVLAVPLSQRKRIWEVM